MIEIRPVQSKADWETFIDLPWAIYKNDPHWVPPLKIAVRDQLDVDRHPFFKHAVMRPLLAYRGGKCVGRVIGVVDEKHNQYHQEKTAFFGFFEATDDQSVANALLDAVLKWAKEKGMNRLRGPMNPSTNYECGLLVEGFDDTPAVMMTYNPFYYEKLLTTWGLEKSMDLFAYDFTQQTKFSERVLAQAERLKQNGSVTFRSANMSKFDDEVERILDIYNDAWEKNWGFVPMDRDEFRHLAKDMKMIVDPELLLMAEVRGEPAGFALTLPDVNQVFKKVTDGKLFPTGLFKLLWNLKGPGRKKTINRCRIITLGIKKAYQPMGLGPLFYAEYFKRGVRLGYSRGEASWILENNRLMNRSLELMAGKRNKVYRIFDKAIS